MSRIIRLEATISVEDDVEIDEISLPFGEFLYNELPRRVPNKENYSVLDSDVDTLFDN